MPRVTLRRGFRRLGVVVGFVAAVPAGALGWIVGAEMAPKIPQERTATRLSEPTSELRYERTLEALRNASAAADAGDPDAAEDARKLAQIAARLKSQAGAQEYARWIVENKNKNRPDDEVIPLTLEQRKAIASASARLRVLESATVEGVASIHKVTPENAQQEARLPKIPPAMHARRSVWRYRALCGLSGASITFGLVFAMFETLGWIVAGFTAPESRRG